MSAYHSTTNPGQPVNMNLNAAQQAAPYDGTYNLRQYSVYTPTTGYAPRAALIMAGVGALVGGSAAAAKNIRRVRNQEIDRREAVGDTAREAAGAAVATGLATAVMSGVNTGNLLSLTGTFLLATGAKYLWDSAFCPAAACPCNPPSENK